MTQEIKLEGELKQIMNREKARKVNRNIRRMNGSQHDTSTSMIEITKPDGTVEDITEKSELERQIMETNKAKFLQCKNTPFYREPLSLYFDEACRSENYDRIYNGTFECPAEVDKYSKALLEQMEKHPGCEEIPVDLPTKTLQDEWKHSKESTSSGISKLSLNSVFKSSIKNSLFF